MGFVIPSSKSKRYLSGSDWVISALDYLLKIETCAGNMSQVVIMLDDMLGQESVQDCLSQFIKKFPVLHGSIARDLNLAPYWRIPKKAGADLNFNVYHVKNSSQKGVLSLLEKSGNKPFKSNNEHLAFHLIQTETGKSCFAMTFDHRLFDARGAEAFLNLFQHYLAENKGSGIAKDIRLTASASLSQWVKKFYAGRNVNRKILALSKSPPESLPLPPGKNKGFKFKLITFNPQETEEIYNNAYSEAGYLMEMPYLLSVVIQTVHELFKKKNIPASSYLIPVTIDMRTSEDIRRELFFNHVSYFFFQTHAGDTGNLKDMIKTIKQQMYEQVKSGLPEDILEASLLTRIAPLPVLKKIFRIPFKGEIASFCFSHTGKSSYLFPDFMGVKIENIFHMPRVPVPPGLGFFSNYFNGQLNLVISYLDGLIKDEDIIMLETGMKERLGVR